MGRWQRWGAVWRPCGDGVPALLGNQYEARPGGGTWELLWAHEWGSGRQCQGSPGCRVSGTQTSGCMASVGRHFPSVLPAELSECQGKLQELHRLLQNLESLHRIPSAPVIPTHQVRSRAGRLPPRVSLLLATFIHHFHGTGPQSPLGHCCFQETHTSAWWPLFPCPDWLGVVALPLGSDPFLLCPRHPPACRTSCPGMSVISAPSSQL